MAAFFIGQYLLYLAIYVPSLVVIASRPLIRHSCYKMMLAVGVLDIVIGFFATFLAGVLSATGANYCDNTLRLVVLGHVVHCKKCRGSEINNK